MWNIDVAYFVRSNYRRYSFLAMQSQEKNGIVAHDFFVMSAPRIADAHLRVY